MFAFVNSDKIPKLRLGPRGWAWLGAGVGFGPGARVSTCRSTCKRRFGIFFLGVYSFELRSRFLWL